MPRRLNAATTSCLPSFGFDLCFAAGCCWATLWWAWAAGANRHSGVLPRRSEYVDIRLTRDTINGEQFINLLRLLRDLHPETECFILYVDGAKYYSKPIVKAWLKRNPAFRLSQIPAYSPNVNLIERLWKFMRAEALCKWHKTFAAMQAAVSSVLDHLENYRSNLETVMTETFHIIDKKDIPVEYREVA